MVFSARIGLAAWSGLVLASSAAFAEAPAPYAAPLPPPIPAPAAAAYPGIIALEVDARDVSRRIVSFKETIPVAKAGDLILLYPQWLPGNHAPRGPLDKLAGITFSAGGRMLDWRRDPVNVFAFHVDVPAGVSTIVAEAKYLTPTAGAQGRVVFTDTLASLQWNATVLYPAGYVAAGVRIKPSLRLPAGWSFASALSPAIGKAGAAPVSFAETDLETFVDSPMLAGANFKSFDLDPGSNVPVRLDVFADTADLIAPTPEQLEAHKNLVRQADFLYGARHYDHYDFLLSLSDELGGIGLEHHRSSEDGVGPKYFLDAKSYVNSWDLLPHEFTHSWNGKFRRPNDLYTANYDVPMRGSLLWVYEGMTSYWGEVLAARSGMWSKGDAFASLAATAATYDNRAGRAWRPVEDTTADPIISARRPQPWRSYQRAEDYYTEGLMTWLDADTMIRKETNGAKSLDDFARAFFGIEPGRIDSVTYGFDDIASTLGAVVSGDWATFLNDRLYKSARPSPLAGVERGGWRLVYGDEPNSFIAANETRGKQAFFLYSLGFTAGERGALQEVLWDGPAFKQGVTVGDTLIAVNGAEYSADGLRAAITAAKSSKAAIVLTVKRGDRYRAVTFDYHGGLRYPRLERIDGTPDLLSAIYAPRKQ